MCYLRTHALQQTTRTNWVLLLNHLVGDGKQLAWNRETERFGRGQIDDEIELSRLASNQGKGRQALRLQAFDQKPLVQHH